MVNKIIKNCCAICGNNELKTINVIPNIPVYMGATSVANTDYLFSDLVYVKCTKCKNLQLSELIPLEILYQDNHNIDVVGETWEKHNNEFAAFVKESKPSIVMEIGSASPKIFNKIESEKWLLKWYAIEPNPDTDETSHDKFHLIKKFLDNDFYFKEHNMEQPNAVVMSHVFEHLYYPSETLNILHKNLLSGDSIFISIPNMKFISDNNLMPPSGLHFEHTYYVELENINHLFENCGFKISDVRLFKNHSFFIKATKQEDKIASKIKSELKKTNLENIHNFNKTIKEYKNIVKKINKKIKDTNSEVYLYGGHFPSQLLLSLGLNDTKIIGCLDQSSKKINRKLYGTNFNIFSPEILREKSSVYVICYMGPYTDEIKRTLLNINDKIVFL